jgi:hypothetical protein
MWGQCHPLFAFPSSVETHNAMTIRAAEQQLPMSRLFPYQANINFLCLSIQYQIQESYYFVTGLVHLCLKAMPLKYSRFPQKSNRIGCLMEVYGKKFFSSRKNTEISS